MTHHLSTHRSNPLLVASTLLAALGCILLTACGSLSAQKNDDNFTTPRRVTLSGISVCLPHRDTSGPQTMECAFGLKTDDGSHYALDLSVLQTDELMDFPTNERLTLEGTLTPLEEIDEHTWKIYDIVGHVRVAAVLHPGS